MRPTMSFDSSNSILWCEVCGVALLSGCEVGRVATEGGAEWQFTHQVIEKILYIYVCSIPIFSTKGGSMNI